MDESAYLTDCSTISHNSISTIDSKAEFVPSYILIVLKRKNSSIISRAKHVFKCKVSFVPLDEFNPEEDLPDCSTLVVLDDFQGPVFDSLRKKVPQCPYSIQVRGPPAFWDACIKQRLETYTRPIYNFSMLGMVYWVSGFDKRKKLKTEFVNLLKYMGASVTKNAGNRVTNVISESIQNEGYEYASTFPIPASSIRWVYDCWERRNEEGFNARSLDLDSYTLKIFSNLFVCFLGFHEDNIHIQRLHENDGILVERSHPRLTHIVVNDGEDFPSELQDIRNVFVVSSVWYWTSIKEEKRANEDLYKLTHKPRSPEVCQRRSYSQNCHVPSAPALSSPTCTYEETGTLNNNESCTLSLFTNQCSSKKSYKLLELVQTEENYVNVLSTIMKIQEQTIDPTQAGGALLTEQEARIIFGHIKSIYNTHLAILGDLYSCAENWNEAKTIIGPIFSNRTKELLDCYKPFIMCFDLSNNILTDCEKNKPRFHAYLQLCKNTECGKQNMKDLLIRPVQRLASTSLLLKDLIKGTSPEHADYLKLQEALKNVELVMKAINSQRKDVDRAKVLFDIFNLIENCPPNLISAGRRFIFQFEAQELSEAHIALSKRGDYLVFYMFSDCLEVCRKKKKVVATTKEGDIINHQIMKLTHGKPYKHVILMQYSSIRSLDNIVSESYDTKGEYFGLTCRNYEEFREKHYLFRFIKYANTNCDSSTLLEGLKKVMEQCKATAMTVEPKIVTRQAEDVGLVTNLGGLNSLTNFAYRTKVFMESVLKNIDNSPPGVNPSVPSSNFRKSLSLDNLLSEMQSKQEDTSALQTASFPVGKR